MQDAPIGAAMLAEHLQNSFRCPEICYDPQMIYRFGAFALDPDRGSLCRNGEAVPMERQVWELLHLFVANADRLISRNEIVTRIWGGRAISDAAIDSRISSLRKVLGDDGQRQADLKTVHGRGFRFIAPVRIDGAPVVPRLGDAPSVAVLPLVVLGGTAELRAFADAFIHDLIQALSRLHWLVVIARGSTFRFRDAQVPTASIAATLDARYVMSGTAEDHRTTRALSLLLEDTATGRVIWSDRSEISQDEIANSRNAIACRIAAEIESDIPAHEALSALGLGTEALDAWGHYHLGIERMYRFTQADNLAATDHFQQALRLDPRFARARAGLSFTSFQDAFLHYAPADEAIRAARTHAEEAMALDPRDPFAALTLGRSRWLEDAFDDSTFWIGKAIELNPNYAQAHYVLGLVNVLTGKTEPAMACSGNALRLSPIDPLTYGMIGVRSFGSLQRGDVESAASLADRAARTPGAHFVISMIATAMNEIAGHADRAASWSATTRDKRPDASRAQFFNSLRFVPGESRRRLDAALVRHGF